MTSPRDRRTDRVYRTFEWILERLPGGAGERARQATGGRFGIGSQIAVGLGGGVLLTISAILLALLLMSIVQRGQSAVTNEQIPALVAGHQVTKHSEALVRASPRLLAASDPAAVEEVMVNVLAEQDSLQYWVREIAETAGAVAGTDEPVEVLAEDLVASINEIRESVGNRMAYEAQLTEMRADVEAQGFGLQAMLEEAIDDQHFFYHTGLRELDDVPAPVSRRRSLDEFEHYSGLVNFKASENEAITYIQQALTETDGAQLLANHGRVETALSDARDALPRIRPPLRETLAEAFDALSDIYQGPTGIFQTRRREIAEIDRSEDLLARNEQTTAELDVGVEALMERVQMTARAAANRSESLVRLGFWFLLGVTLLTVGAARVAWTTFGRPLILRLSNLFDTTRRMSEGDLDAKVRVEGNDEVADMAGALEVFRQHAVEVQRLNLVEKLAGEVQAKNEALEETLERLRRTQEQVVMQEKLASLGALTAGIAHEIRNPLNFVNNFAALSRELIDELKEEMEETAGENGEIDRELLTEILDDLDMNVSKVREHGGRADRIVEGMLAHSRDEAGHAEAINVNQVVDEYAKLAYQGLRGTDSSFNVTIEREFDENAGTVVGIGRDISRVFLNIVTNACHATAARAEEADGSYSPTVRLRTVGADDHVVIVVRDNGTGIPESIIRKIFEPFFTTKSGTQGTGLGLSISRDIIVGHGGELEVESEAGEFTEFRITLPRESNIDEVTAAAH